MNHMRRAHHESTGCRLGIEEVQTAVAARLASCSQEGRVREFAAEACSRPGMLYHIRLRVAQVLLRWKEEAELF